MIREEEKHMSENESAFIKRIKGGVKDELAARQNQAEAAAQTAQTNKDILNRTDITLGQRLETISPTESKTPFLAPAEPKLSTSEQILQGGIDQQKR
jgi:uncharacterized damage-inducible protein DinB